MILSNQIRCNQCKEAVYSAHRHDLQYCKCGMVAVDGGMDYLRRLGKDYEDESIVILPWQYELLKEAVESEEKNTLGKVCWIARIFRDNFSINLSEYGDKNG